MYCRICRLNDVASSVFAFMSLFDDVKKLLATNDAHDGIVDVDMKGSVFGKCTCVYTDQAAACCMPEEL